MKNTETMLIVVIAISIIGLLVSLSEINRLEAELEAEVIQSTMWLDLMDRKVQNLQNVSTIIQDECIKGL